MFNLEFALKIKVIFLFIKKTATKINQTNTLNIKVQG